MVPRISFTCTEMLDATLVCGERCISLVLSSHFNVLLLRYACKGDAVHDRSAPVMEDVLEAITKQIKGYQAVK